MGRGTFGDMCWSAVMYLQMSALHIVCMLNAYSE